jgi:hypothetical protein
MARRKNDKRDDPIWICVNSLIHDGHPFNHGETYRESELEAVRRDAPESFIRWPATTGEMRRANAAIMARALEPEPEPEPPLESTVSHKMVRALRGMQIGGALTRHGGRADAMTILREGDELPEDHPLVRQNRENFEPVT